jgi:hypothetical protein
MRGTHGKLTMTTLFSEPLALRLCLSYSDKRDAKYHLTHDGVNAIGCRGKVRTVMTDDAIHREDMCASCQRKAELLGAPLPVRLKR